LHDGAGDPSSWLRGAGHNADHCGRVRLECRYVRAAAATAPSNYGWRLQAAEIPGGETLTVTSADASDLDKIRCLGFIGITVGMHHQEHHLAIATGQSPH
jgi:hypothetical protein